MVRMAYFEKSVGSRVGLATSLVPECRHTHYNVFEGGKLWMLGIRGAGSEAALN